MIAYLCIDEIENEMYNRRTAFLSKLGKIVHPEYQNEFASILHYSWQENLPEADKIIEDLDISPIEFVAFIEDVEEFHNMLKEDQYAGNF